MNLYLTTRRIRPPVIRCDLDQSQGGFIPSPYDPLRSSILGPQGHDWCSEGRTGWIWIFIVLVPYLVSPIILMKRRFFEAEVKRQMEASTSSVKYEAS